MEDRMTAQKLKNSILQMAVQGKLVPQDPNDEPASVLLERIRKEKEKLIKEGKIKRNKNESYIFRGADNLHYEQIGKEIKCIEDELPFEIPDSWEWCKLDSICSKLVDGDHNPPKGINIKTNYLMCSSTNINNDKLTNLEKVRYLTEEVFNKENERTKCKKGDIFFTSVGSLGRSCIYDENLNICFQRSVSIITTLIFNLYLKYYFDNPSFQSKVNKEATGTAQKGFYLNQLATSMIAVPPLNEQYRIVNKIKELEPLIEKYKHSEEQLYELNSSIKEQIKKSILQYAIEGKLVPQDPNDEPASILLERVRKEKEKLIAEGKIKKDKNESMIYRRDNSYYEKQSKNDVCIDEQIPFSIPNSWCWIRFKEFTSFNIGKTPERDNDQFWFEGEYPWVSIADLVENGLVNSTKEKISKLALDKKFSNKLVKQGTLLMSFKLTVGKTSILDIDAVHNEAIISITPYLDYNNMTRNYLFYSMPLLSLNGETKKAIKGNTLNSKSLNALLIPVPPIQEQRRIVDMIIKLNNLIG